MAVGLHTRRTREWAGFSLLVLAAAGGAWLSLATLLGTARAAPAPLPAEALASQQLERAFSNLSFSRMVHLTHAGDGTNRLWVVLQARRIMVFPNDQAASSSQVFLDITSQVSTAGDEEGLLGMAFDPGYAGNGFFYVYYSASSPRRSVVSRFSVSKADPDQADPDSELVLLQIDQPFSNHNGGTVSFGPDGYLYVGLGDGGSGGDPQGNGQNTATLLGSILRIDVSSATAQEPYAIPSGNPFVGPSGSRGEIWAYGLRNPWKFSFDPLTGDLWLADVGQSNNEEIDIIKRGGNYGWNIMEGLHCYPPSAPSCDQTGLEPPVFEYPLMAGNCAIAGGHVYRGARLPVLAGAYIYADYCSGRIWALRHDGSAVTEQGLLIDSALTIPAIGADENGELYILTFEGGIYRFVAPLEPTPAATTTPSAVAQPPPTPPPAGDGALGPLVLSISLFGTVLAGAAGVWLVLRRRAGRRT